MSRIAFVLVAAGLAACATEPPPEPTAGCLVQRGTPAEAAERLSPLDSASVDLGGSVVTLCYGSPAVRGRDVMGGLVPWDEPWRMGANEATTLHTPVPLDVAGVRIEPGSYSLYAVPSPDRWTLVVNGDWHRWGIPIDGGVRASDLGTAEIRPEEAGRFTERLSYRFEPGGARTAELIFEWERTRIRIPLRVAR